MLREVLDCVDAALVKLREGPSFSMRRPVMSRPLHGRTTSREASDVAAAAADTAAPSEKERARLTVLMDCASALEGLSGPVEDAVRRRAATGAQRAGSARTGGRSLDAAAAESPAPPKT